MLAADKARCLRPIMCDAMDGLNGADGMDEMDGLSGIGGMDAIGHLAFKVHDLGAELAT